MSKEICSLDREIFKTYGDRKRKGRLDLVAILNEDTTIFCPVPKDQEHSKFIPEIRKNIIKPEI